MTPLPPLAAEDRLSDAAILPLVSVAQAALLGLGVFATRSIFEALHGDGIIGVDPFLVLGACGLGAAGLEFLARRRAEALGQSYAASLRLTLYAHIAGMSRATLSERRLGGLSLRFVGDLSAARGWFGQGIPRFLSAAIILPGAALVLFLLDARLAWAGTVPIAAACLFAAIAAWGLDARHEVLRRRRASISIGMIERIAMSPELDLMGRTRKETASLRRNGQDLRRNAVARRTRIGALHLILQAGAVTAGVAVLWVTADQRIPPGSGAAALSLLIILSMPLRDLADAWDQYCAWRIAKAKMLRLLSFPSQRRGTGGHGEPAGFTVTSKPPSRAMRMVFPAGKTIVLRGTDQNLEKMARTIVGLDKPEDLEVIFGGGATPRITYVGPRPTILRGSLRRNLTLGARKRPSDTRILEIASAFGLDPAIDRLGGLSGRVAEKALNLTQGEWIRVELARAVLTKAALVVIDCPCPEAAAPGLIDRLRSDLSATIVLAMPNAPNLKDAIRLELAPEPVG